MSLLTKVHIVKAVVFSVVMYGCESWTIKKTECGRIDAFELWCWRRLLRVPWTARRPNQSILKEINPEYSLEGLMLKLKLQYFGHLMWRALVKTLMLGKIEYCPWEGHMFVHSSRFTLPGRIIPSYPLGRWFIEDSSFIGLDRKISLATWWAYFLHKALKDEPVAITLDLNWTTGPPLILSAPLSRNTQR